MDSNICLLSKTLMCHDVAIFAFVCDQSICFLNAMCPKSCQRLRQKLVVGYLSAPLDVMMAEAGWNEITTPTFFTSCWILLSGRVILQLLNQSRMRSRPVNELSKLRSPFEATLSEMRKIKLQYVMRLQHQLLQILVDFI